MKHFRKSAKGLILPDREIWRPRVPAIIGRARPLEGIAYVGLPTAGVAPLSGTITFVEANFGRGTGPFSFGATAPQNSLVLLYVVDHFFPWTIPTAPGGGGWIPIDSVLQPDSPGIGQILAYQVPGVGGLATTGTWANAEGIAWWIATNPRGTWIIGADGEVAARDSNAVYAACTPNGTTDWCVSFLASGGGFTIPALTAGTGVTQRQLNGAANPQFGIFDSNGVATTWPGQTTSPGYTAWGSYAIPIRAGA